MQFRFESIYVGGDHGVGGIQEFVGSECDYQLAGLHERDTSAEQQGLAQVMGDEDHRFSQALLQGQESRCSSARVMGSSAPKGSSIRSNDGSAARARATPTLWRCPPDSSRG